MEKNFVFDMDGVLLDTERMIIDCWIELGEKHGIPDIETAFRKCIGTTRIETEHIIMDFYGPDFSYEKFRIESSALFQAKEKTSGIPVKEGARELLTYLRDEHYQIALATSTRKVNVIRELTQTNLLHYFNEIITGDMVSKSKPAPDIYLKACSALHATPSQTYAVEDSLNGLISATTATLPTFLIPDLISPTEQMKKMSLRTYPSLLNIIEYLSQNN